MPRSKAVDRLLSAGLELYGQSRYDEAIDRWREVLRLQPNNQTTLEYLDSLGGGKRRRAEVDMLIGRGLNFYSLGDQVHAANEWLQVLMFDPENVEASDYLSSIEIQHLPGYANTVKIEPERLIRSMQLTLSDLSQANDRERSEVEGGGLHGESIKIQLLDLLKNHEFDLALELLDELIESSYTAPELKRSKQLIRHRMVLKFVRLIGGDHRMAKLECDKNDLCQKSGDYELCYLLEIIDGKTSIADILAISPLGRFRTYRHLWQLLESRAVSFVDPANRFGRTIPHRPQKPTTK